MSAALEPAQPTLAEVLAEVRALRDEVRQLRKTTPEQLVDLHQAPAHLGVDERTLRRWVAAEKVPYRRIGRTLHFPLARLNPAKLA